MADWSVNNRACTSVWTALRLLEQNRKVFDSSGDIPMKKLLFFNKAASAPVRKQQATTLAKQLDNLFRQIDGAEFEQGVKVGAAVRAMTDVLTTADLTIADLAETCDDLYRFWGEG